MLFLLSQMPLLLSYITEKIRSPYLLCLLKYLTTENIIKDRDFPKEGKRGITPERPGSVGLYDTQYVEAQGNLKNAGFNEIFTDHMLKVPNPI